jgi:hypothetical protein
VQAALEELDTEKAPLASPALTGDPTAPTPATSDNDTSIATTAFVQANKIVFETNANDIFQVSNPGAASVFAALLNGDPTNVANSVCTFDTVTAGSVAVITPVSTSQLAKLRIYNTTRGTYALILSATGATFTTTTNVYAAGWRNNDVLTIASQTVTGSGLDVVDLELTSGPTGKSAILITGQLTPGAASNRIYTHPFVAYSAPKGRNIWGQVASVPTALSNVPIAMAGGNVFSIAWSGVPTSVILREDGYLP